MNVTKQLFLYYYSPGKLARPSGAPPKPPTKLSQLKKSRSTPEGSLRCPDGNQSVTGNSTVNEENASEVLSSSCNSTSCDHVCSSSKCQVAATIKGFEAKLTKSTSLPNSETLEALDISNAACTLIETELNSDIKSATLTTDSPQVLPSGSASGNQSFSSCDKHQSDFIRSTIERLNISLTLEPDEDFDSASENSDRKQRSRSHSPANILRSDIRCHSPEMSHVKSQMQRFEKPNDLSLSTGVLNLKSEKWTVVPSHGVQGSPSQEVTPNSSRAATPPRAWLAAMQSKKNAENSQSKCDSNFSSMSWLKTVEAMSKDGAASVIQSATNENCHETPVYGNFPMKNVPPPQKPPRRKSLGLEKTGDRAKITLDKNVVPSCKNNANETPPVVPIRKESVEMVRNVANRGRHRTDKSPEMPTRARQRSRSAEGVKQRTPTEFNFKEFEEGKSQDIQELCNQILAMTAEFDKQTVDEIVNSAPNTPSDMPKSPVRKESLESIRSEGSNNKKPKVKRVRSFSGIIRQKSLEFSSFSLSTFSWGRGDKPKEEKAKRRNSKDNSLPLRLTSGDISPPTSSVSSLKPSVIHLQRPKVRPPPPPLPHKIITSPEKNQQVLEDSTENQPQTVWFDEHGDPDVEDSSSLLLRPRSLHNRLRPEPVDHVYWYVCICVQYVITVCAKVFY